MEGTEFMVNTQIPNYLFPDAPARTDIIEIHLFRAYISVDEWKGQNSEESLLFPTPNAPTFSKSTDFEYTYRYIREARQNIHTKPSIHIPRKHTNKVY